MSLLLAIGIVIVANASSFVGFILPPFVELLNKDVKNDNERYIVTVIVCSLVAVLLHWSDVANGTPQNIIPVAGIIFLESTTVFKLYFQNSSLQRKIQGVGDTPPPPIEESGGVQ